MLTFGVITLGDHDVGVITCWWNNPVHTLGLLVDQWDSPYAQPYWYSPPALMYSGACGALGVTRPPHGVPRVGGDVVDMCARIMRARGRAQRARAYVYRFALLISSVDRLELLVAIPRPG